MVSYTHCTPKIEYSINAYNQVVPYQTICEYYEGQEEHIQLAHRAVTFKLDLNDRLDPERVRFVLVLAWLKKCKKGIGKPQEYMEDDRCISGWLWKTGDLPNFETWFENEVLAEIKKLEEVWEKRRLKFPDYEGMREAFKREIRGIAARR
jgi:hypothetical protein